MNKLTIALLGSIFLFGCQSMPTTIGAQQNSNQELDNVKNNFDWVGNYHGMLPCGTCAGIEVSLTLNGDQTYKLVENYINMEDGVFVSQGKFRWEQDGSTIMLAKEKPNQYIIGKNSIQILNVAGKPVEGYLAQFYYLRKSK